MLSITNMMLEPSLPPTYMLCDDIQFVFFFAVKHACKKSEFVCSKCPKVFASKTTLRRHLQTRHNFGTTAYPSFCVDATQGIYLVAKTDRGLAAPIHVCKNTRTKTLYCTEFNCRDIMQAAADFNPGFECKHLQAVQFTAPSDSKPLNEKSIIQLHLMNIISESTVKQCLNLIAVADDVGAPLVAMFHLQI